MPTSPRSMQWLITTRAPSASATSAALVSSRVLPTPASPDSRIAPGSPARARATANRMRSNCAARATNGEPAADLATPSIVAVSTDTAAVIGWPWLLDRCPMDRHARRRIPLGPRLAVEDAPAEIALRPIHPVGDLGVRPWSPVHGHRAGSLIIDGERGVLRRCLHGSGKAATLASA